MKLGEMGGATRCRSTNESLGLASLVKKILDGFLLFISISSFLIHIFHTSWVQTKRAESDGLSVFRGNFDISSSQNDWGKLNIVPKPEKCKFSGAKSKIRYLGGSKRCQKAPKLSKLKKKLIFFFPPCVERAYLPWYVDSEPGNFFFGSLLYA